MGNLISRQAAIDILMKEWKAYKDYPYVSHVRHGLEIAIAILENKVPSAQPERCEDCRNFNKARLLIPQPERKKGHWIKMSDTDGIYWACSECGEDIPRVPHYNPQFDLFPRLESIEKTKFCPNCGAKMEVEE